MKVILIGTAIVVLCLAVQVLASVLVTHNVARLDARGKLGRGFWSAVLLLGGTVLILLGSFMAQIALWAAVFMLSGEFTSFDTALYHSGVNYATLGYGDIVMSPRWRSLGFLEAVNGMLMGGLAAALLFAVMGRLYQSTPRAHTERGVDRSVGAGRRSSRGLDSGTET